MIGTRIAHFQITAKLGEGGMGEVWRAEDERLGREVALKLLPEVFLADPERRARFEREARVLASLSHPNIAAVHEFGEAVIEAGAGRGDASRPRAETPEATGPEADRGGVPVEVHYLAMELAPGETLADRIGRAPIPLEEAIAVALQIAEGLEAAHQRGIIHRDLKPANVKVDEEGTVKILDFGLAKALEPEAGAAAGSLTHSPTLTFQATQAGVLLGTAAYMSPEQAAGKPADHRADIWAFGVVLLEMLTGKRTFEGETVTHVLASVLKEEPDYDRLLAGIPARVADVIRRCLRKDPRQRLQSIGDARIRLEEWLADPEGGTDFDDRAAMSLPAGVGPSTRVPWTAAALAALAALVFALLWITTRSGPSGTPSEALHFALALPKGTILALDDQDDVLAISPDGGRQVLVVKDPENVRHLALVEQGRAEARILPGTDGASSPFFSPDGEWVAFFAGGFLQKSPVAGGPPVKIKAAIGQNRGATWSPDGYIYGSGDITGGLQRVHESGGPLETVTELDDARSERTHRWPDVIAAGEAILFTSDTAESTEFYDDARIEAVRTATGERTVLLEQSSRARYLPPNRLVFARGGVLYAVSFDPETLEVTGSPRVVQQGVLTTEVSGAAHFDIAETGSLLFAPGEVSSGTTTPMWVHLEDGRTEPAGIQPGVHIQLALAPDDRRVALASSVAQSQEIWIADLERQTLTRLTFHGSSTADPVWTPDGEWIVYHHAPSTLAAGDDAVYRRRADGTGDAERLWTGDFLPSHFTPDGKILLIERYDENPFDSDIFAVPWDAGEQPRPLLESPLLEGMSNVSPDGRWIAYVSGESGRGEVYVRSFPDLHGKWQISTQGGFEPRWAPNGEALYYRWAGNLFRVDANTERSFQPGSPRRVASGLEAAPNPHSYSVSRDGSRVLYLGSSRESSLDRAHLIIGWGTELSEVTRD